MFDIWTMKNITVNNYCNTTNVICNEDGEIIELSLSKLAIEDIYDNSICNIKSLKNLNMSHNNLTKIPYEITNCTNLEVIDISHNSIQIIPDYINKLQHLKLLNISNNSIGKYKPIDELIDLPQLLYLDISNNNMQAPSAILKSLPNLKYLDISGNLMYDSGRIINMDNLETLLASRTVGTIMHDIDAPNLVRYIGDYMYEGTKGERATRPLRPLFSNVSIIPVIKARNLRYISLRGSDRLYTSTVRYIIGRNKYLEYADFGDSKIVVSELAAVKKKEPSKQGASSYRNGKSLKYVDVGGRLNNYDKDYDASLSLFAPDNNIEYINASMHFNIFEWDEYDIKYNRLQVLDLHGFRSSNSLSINKILESAPNLVTLDLSKSSVYGNITNIKLPTSLKHLVLCDTTRIVGSISDRVHGRMEFIYIAQSKIKPYHERTNCQTDGLCVI
ncbi:uncharacterized protein LOC126324522 [Schistocerca gregaria]|uniref:uncharacterized protein LOC126324522 n=1 Tax=Schistocerca gregaria TaxID=7010 RepID=UPI00211F2EA7|nr:uncharacterized protein LOC126324522 [Schistocerca gregaria]